MGREKFIPRTKTVNTDREYYIEGTVFSKVDSNIERGKREFSIQSKLRHLYIPRAYKAYTINGFHTIEMEMRFGDTLENLKLSLPEKRTVLTELLEIQSYLLSIGIVHGDINESNILFDGKTISLLDWEMASDMNEENWRQDLLGGPWGIADLVSRVL